MDSLSSTSASTAPVVHPKRGVRNLAILLLLVAWSFGVGAGLQWIWRYQSTPGRLALAPERWPAPASMPSASRRPILVMFLHPLCSCSRASLAELREVVARNPGQLTVWLLFLKSPNLAAPAEQSALWQTAKSIPGVNVAADPDGVEARRFGAQTSGHLAVYGSDRNLLFSGGITESRGHVGDNSHLEQVLSVLAGSTAPGSRFAPVYGCALNGRTPTRT